VNPNPNALITPTPTHCKVDERVVAELGIGTGAVAIEMNPMSTTTTASTGGYGEEEGDEERLVVHIS